MGWLLAVVLALVFLPGMAWVGVRAAYSAFAHRRYVDYVRHKGLDAEIPDLADHLRDGLSNALLTLWRLLPGLPRVSVPQPTRGRPVLCVHGFVGRGSDFRGLRRALQLQGRPTAAPDLGFAFRGVASYAPPLEGTLEALIEAFGDVDVVAHSMGGLVLRTVLERRPDLARSVRTVVTLGTPHRGTASTRGLPPGRPPDLDDLKRGSAFHRDLPELAELVPGGRVITVAGTVDLVVYPVSTCHPAGSLGIDLPVGHTELLTSRRAIELVTELVARTTFRPWTSTPGAS